MAVYDSGVQSGATSADVTRILTAFRSGGMSPETFYAQLRAIGYTAEMANHVVQSEVKARTTTLSPDPLAGVRATPEPTTTPVATPESTLGSSPYVTPLTSGQAGVNRPIPEQRSTYQDFLAESEGGRRGLFGAAVRGQNPQSNPFRDYLLSRFEPTQAQYNIESGLGTTPPGSFSEYATGRGQQRLNPDVWRAYLQSASSLLTNPPSNLPQQQADFASWLEDPENQFNLALESYTPNSPAPFRRAAKGRAQDVFNDFLVNQPGQSFLPWFTGRGQRFF